MKILQICRIDVECYLTTHKCILRSVMNIYRDGIFNFQRAFYAIDNKKPYVNVILHFIARDCRGSETVKIELAKCKQTSTGLFVNENELQRKLSVLIKNIGQKRNCPK